MRRHQGLAVLVVHESFPDDPGTLSIQRPESDGAYCEIVDEDVRSNEKDEKGISHSLTLYVWHDCRTALDIAMYSVKRKRT